MLPVVTSGKVKAVTLLAVAGFELYDNSGRLNGRKFALGEGHLAVYKRNKTHQSARSKGFKIALHLHIIL